MHSDYIRWDLSRFPAYGQRFQAHHTLQPRVHSGKSSVRASKLSQIRAGGGLLSRGNTRRRLPLEFVKLITEVCVTHQTGNQLFRAPLTVNAKRTRFGCVSAREEGRMKNLPSLLPVMRGRSILNGVDRPSRFRHRLSGPTGPPRPGSLRVEARSIATFIISQNRNKTKKIKNRLSTLLFLTTAP